MTDQKDFFVHPGALVESSRIGKGTKVWAFAHILPGAVIGEDCNICDHTFIENNVTIGNRVTIKPGVQVWDGVVIEDDVFIGPNVTFTNDHFPRSKHYPTRFATTVVRQGASVGANATILPGLVIGKNAMVGAGTVVTKDVPTNAIVVGNPAQITGYVPTARPQPADERTTSTNLGALKMPTSVPGVTRYTLPLVKDLRGSLSFGEYDRHLPFVPKRYFFNI